MEKLEEFSYISSSNSSENCYNLGYLFPKQNSMHFFYHIFYTTSEVSCAGCERSEVTNPSVAKTKVPYRHAVY